LSEDEDYVFDEESGEWMPASQLAAKQADSGAVEVRDAVGNLLADGDQVTLIEDLEVKGAGQTLSAARSSSRSASPATARKSIAATRASRASSCAPSS